MPLREHGNKGTGPKGKGGANLFFETHKTMVLGFLGGFLTFPGTTLSGNRNSNNLDPRRQIPDNRSEERVMAVPGTLGNSTRTATQIQ
jgi:hypothetical protein